MYQDCNCQNNGLGFITELVSAATSIFGGKGGSDGGSAASPSSPITVSPQISTQVSPQISPVFQQQFQPQNSAATAGTAQSLPGVGAPPGGVIPVGYGAPAVPTVPQAPTDWGRYVPYALGAVAIFAAYKVFSKRRKGAA